MEEIMERVAQDLVAPQQVGVRSTRLPHVPQAAHVSTVELHLQVIERVIRWMRHELSEPLTLQNMADVANLSAFHFSRVFSRVTGIPPCRFLAALRLEYAKQLLLTSQLSATDVCFEVGYNSLGTFTTQFTQMVGISPARFRRFSAHPSLSGLSMLQTFRNHGLPRMLRSAGIVGSITSPKPLEGVIFIGLYPNPIPQGVPVGWTMLTEPGHYHIPPVPNGYYWLLAAAFHWSDDPCAFLLPQQEHMYVAASNSLIQIEGMHLVESTQLILRQPQLIDPPILSALPILLNQCVSVRM